MNFLIWWRKCVEIGHNHSLALSIYVLVASLFVGLGSWFATYNILHAHAEKIALESIETDMKVAWNEMSRYGSIFSLKKGALYLDDIPLAGRLDIVDNITTLVGSTATIFQYDLRVATSVRMADGQRAMNTHLQKNEAYKSIFEDKKPYRGIVEILGVPYITGYDPVFGRDGEVIGILYVGKKVESYFAPIKKIELFIGLIILLAVLAGFLITVLSNRLVKRKMIKDPLTGANNRQSGEEALQMAYSRAVEYGYHLVFAFVDLDDFKVVNDTFGHAVGDSILKSVSESITKVIRKSDVVIRWGGDEFLVLLNGTSENEACEVLSRLISDESVSLFWPDGQKQSVSIGLAAYEPHNSFGEGNSIDELISAADFRMYQAKNNGKNQIFPAKEV